MVRRVACERQAIKTVAFNIATQATGAGLNLVFLPLTAHALGLEAFGLVGVAATVQAIVFVFDGCNVMTRLVARATGSGHGAPPAALVQAMESMYLRWATIGALVTAALAWFLSEYLQSGTSLTMAVASQAAVLIVAGAWVKLMASFYRGCVVGFERFNRANAVALVCYVIRFPIAYLAVTWTADVRLFLAIQLLSFVIEAVALRFSPDLRNAYKDPHDVAPELADSDTRLCSQRTFLFGTFILGAIGTASLQLDKLILATSLSLAEFGAASLAIMMCSGIMVLATPIHQFFLPRMSAASADSGTGADPLPRLLSTLAAVVSPVGATIAVCAPWIAPILAPSGHDDNSAMAKALMFYGLGNAAVALSSALYLEYFAAGHVTRYRVIVLGYLAIYIPLIIFGSQRYGLTGAGSVWLLGNAGLFAALAFDLRRWRTRSNIELDRILLGLGALALVLTGAATLVNAETNVTAIGAVWRIGVVYAVNTALSLTMVWLTWNVSRRTRKGARP